MSRRPARETRTARGPHVGSQINLHHFIVDRVISRVRRDPNLHIVVGQAGTREALPAPSPALGLG